MGFWLVKSEPGAYSFDDLLRDKKTHWNGVRNFQARNFLKDMKKGDQALFYHSNDGKSVMGVVREAYPDDSANEGDWVMVDVKPVKKLTHPVELTAIKKHPKLSKILLVKQSRLSVMPVTKDEFDTIVKLGG
jgi:predicted RNA-binding protein with PUA-like domain